MVLVVGGGELKIILTIYLLPLSLSNRALFSDELFICLLAMATPLEFRVILYNIFNRMFSCFSAEQDKILNKQIVKAYWICIYISTKLQ